MIKRAMLMILGVLPAALILSGCPAGPTRSSDEVLMLMAVPAGEVEAWQKSVDAFEKEHDIKVLLRNEPPERFHSVLDGMIDRGEAPDVVLLDSMDFPHYLNRRELTSLNLYLRGEDAVSADEFFSFARELFEHEGELYGLPHDLGVVCLAYNQNLFEVAVLPEPTAQWTWENYLAAARYITADQTGDGRTDTFGTTACAWWQLYVWQNGADLMDDPRRPTRSTLSDPRAVEALTFLADLNLTHNVAPPPAVFNREERVNIFVAGRIGMLYAWQRDLPHIMKTRDFRWATAPLPSGPDGIKANLGQAMGLVIPEKALRPDDGWKLANFLCGRQGYLEGLNMGYWLPAREDIAHSRYYYAGPDALANPFLSGIPQMRQMPRTPRMAEIMDIYNTELERLWTGQASAEAVAADIDRQVNQILSQGTPATAWIPLRLAWLRQG